MKSKDGKNFFAEHYAAITLVAGFAVCGLCVALSLKSLSLSKARASQKANAAIEGLRAGGSEYKEKTVPVLPGAPSIPADRAGEAGFMMPAKYVFCTPGDPADERRSCGMAFPASALDGDNPVCPYCRTKQPGAKPENLSLDSDGDGIPDAWETANGLNPSNPEDAKLDTDGDGFTALEEFEAKTDPRNAKSHPDYLDYVKISEPVKQEPMPYYCLQVNPAGRVKRFIVRDARTNANTEPSYGVAEGEPINISVVGPSRMRELRPTGWSVTNYVEKVEEVKIAGADIGGNAGFRKVDVSTIDFVREKDGKRITMRIGEAGRKTPLEMKCCISFDRQNGKGFGGKEAYELQIAPGDEFTLYADKFKVEKLDGDAAFIKNLATGSVREIK